MATRLHVNGLATVKVNSSTLGWTVDGVVIEFIGYFEDVYTDKNGPRLPQDVLVYGQEARVTCDLIVYDDSVLNAVETLIYNGTYGQTPNVNYGHLLAACGGTFVLSVLKGSNCVNETEGGWIFQIAYLMDNHSVKVGTRVTRHTCVFRCLPDASGVLFTSSL